MALKLNDDAVAYAEQLIQQGRVDREGDWAENQPTADSENQYLQSTDNNYKEYGKWFLGVNPDANPDTKERYEFPYGNFKKVYRSGLIAAEQRAGQYHHEDIKAAARKLLDMVG